MSEIQQYNQLTEKEIILRFKEAAITLKRLPSVKPNGYFNSWPDIIYSEREIMRMDKKTRIWTATPDAISRMEKTFLWLNLLEEVKDRKIVWMRANNTSWEVICKKFATCRSNAFKRWQNAILYISNNC